MSSVEEKGSNDEESELTEPDAGSQSGKTMEGIIKTLNTNNELVGGISEKNPQTATNIVIEASDKEPNDSKVDILTEKSENENDLVENSLKNDSGVGSGDSRLKSVIQDDVNEAADINKATSSQTDFNPGNTDSSLDKSVLDGDTANIDDEAIDDDDLELKWDGDDDDDQVMMDDEKKPTIADEVTGDKVTVDSDISSEKNHVAVSKATIQDTSEDSLGDDILNEPKNNSELELETGDVTDISAEEERLLLEETDGLEVSEEAVPMKDDLLSKETNKDRKSEGIPDKAVLTEDSKKEALKDISSESSITISEPSLVLSDKVSLPEEPKNDNVIEKLQEDIFVAEAYNKVDSSGIKNTTVDDKKDLPYQTKSKKNAKVGEIDNITTEKTNITNLVPTQKGTETEKDIPKQQETEEMDGNLLKEKLLEEPDTVIEESASKMDESMDIDKENEEELLKSTLSLDDSSSAMDVDIANEKLDEAINNQPVIDEMQNPTENPLDTKMQTKQGPQKEQEVDENINKNPSVYDETTYLNAEIEKHPINAEKSPKDISDELIKNIDDTNLKEPLTHGGDELENLTDPSVQSHLNNQKLKEFDKNIDVNSESQEVFSEKSPKQESTINSDDNEANTSTDSISHIKTDHGVRKPDVMLEIPTQELIDIDDADLSLHYDETEDIDSSNNDESMDKVDDTVSEKILEGKSLEMKEGDKILEKESLKTELEEQNLVTEEVVENVPTEAEKQESSVEKCNDSEMEKEMVEELPRPDTIEETMEKMFAEDVPMAVMDVPAIKASISQQSDVQTSTSQQTAEPLSATPHSADEPSTSQHSVENTSNAQKFIEDQSTKKQSSEQPTTSDQPAEQQSTVSQPAEQTSTSSQPVEQLSTDQQMIEMLSHQTTEKATTSEQPTEQPSTSEQTSTSEQPTEQPSTSQQHTEQPSTSQHPVEQPSTSQQPPIPSISFNTMTPDTSDEVPEVSDSLGLLAESSGRMMDDDEGDDDEDADDDDDFDQDESSNQISAEQSEDSNPVTSDTEAVREEDKEDQTPEPKEKTFEFGMFNAESATTDNVEDKDAMEVDIEGEKVELHSEVMEEETNLAVEALLKDGEGLPTVSEETNKESDVETVKLSDTSDNEGENKAEENKKSEEAEVLEDSKKDTEEQKLASDHSLPKQSPTKQSPTKQSPSKLQKLAIASIENNKVFNIVELEESSSSEDDIQEVQKVPEPEVPSTDQKTLTPISEIHFQEENVTVNIPSSIEVMCTSGGSTSELVTKEGEVVISGIPKPPPQKPARLNTDEVTIKTKSATEPLVIPEAKMSDQQTNSTTKSKLSLEIFSLDSDEEDSSAKEKSPTTKSPHKMTAVELEKARESSKCINYSCTSGPQEIYRMADAATVAYYDAGRKRRAMVCQPCANVVAERTKKLIQGIKDMTPLLDLEMSKRSEDLVEISDSDSEEEEVPPDEPKITIGEKGANLLEDSLAKLLNETWVKYDLDTRLKETQTLIEDEIDKLEKESQEINKMFDECQIATDKLRCDLYATFECRRQELPPWTILDVTGQKFISEPEVKLPPLTPEPLESRLAKRRMSSSTETPSKRPAIPLGYAPLDIDNAAKEPKFVAATPDLKQDDDKDISVVRLSAESAPADLPPPGLISRPPLRVAMPVYAMKNAFGPWLKGKILEIQPKNPAAGIPFAMCRVKFDHKTKNNSGKVLPARCVAYAEPADVRMTIGTRLIALFKDSKTESYYSGVVAEIPNPVNNYRYLVFFDDGYAQYVQHAHTRLVCDSSLLVWEEVHPFSREFVRKYLMAYPERPMVRLHEGQHLKTEWNGKWWSSKVTQVDASLAQVTFLGDGRREWIYRGSTRLAPLYLELQAAERHRSRAMPRSKAQTRMNMPYVEYTRLDGQETKEEPATTNQQREQNEEIRRQRAVAKKSTTPVQAPPPPLQHAPSAEVTSRVVYYTPKNAVKPYKMVPHDCGPQCKRTDVLSLQELRTYNPLAKPLLSGWERQIVRYKGHKEVLYRAPCGRRLRNLPELHAYLRVTDSELPVDLFDFHPGTHCLAEFVLNKCLVGKKDLSHGKENVPVPCVNYIDESLPEFCSYNTERTPTAGVPLNLDPEFLCGCDCTDDCEDKSKCACWKMTLEGAKTIGLEGPNVGYVYKRLPEPLPSGIYECNSRCKCKMTCLNRVAQHPLQLKLQVFKTLNRGWGIRALNDVPKGSFLCVYAGNLLTDATANLDGLNEGDEYLAELDYIEVVEQMKEGYEEDIPEADKKLDKKELGKEDSDEEEETEPPSDDEEAASKSDKEDDDFRPGYIGLGFMEFNKRLRKRDKNKKSKDKEERKSTEEKEKEKEKEKETKESNAEEDCITISDDEEVREPSRFTAQDNMGANEFVSKYKSVRSLFGKDEACYIMDAKVQGNIGRYLNHSCRPNVFVQNVFVDTHDPRFPWVAFFALSHIKAGTELTWNYNYDVGSVPGKVLYCFCGAPNCRGRLL